MRRTAILMLVLSLMLGVVAVYLARDWVQDQVSAAKKVETRNVNLTTVVVAKRPLHFGDEVSSSAVQEVEWPANAVPPGSFSKLAELTGNGERRVVLRSIQINEPVLKSKVSGFGGRATLSTVIEKELRAVTVRVNDVNGVAGFVLPGDHVDVLLTRQLNDAKEQITDVLMQNVKVLGIDQDASEDKDKPKVVRAVTMEVSIDQSQKLTLAQMVGQLSLTLRGATNNEPITHRRIRVRDLVDDSMVKDKAVSAEVAPAPAKPVRKVIRSPRVDTRTSVRVYRGLEPKVHEVAPEAASRGRATGTSGSATPPRRLLPSGAPAAGTPKDTATTDRPSPSTPNGPIPLRPGASRGDGAPKEAPGAAPARKTKTGDSMVDAGGIMPVAVNAKAAR